ncbi:hypothetical protein [Acidovorax sp. Root402]|uniref:hypothetical protein n=1 Tax=Acidovorax sp. Root402 TaxID=1736527 RepID=UPI0012E3D558|nr:hypothetical protein [Acidovorax sp. Root402]
MLTVRTGELCSDLPPGMSVEKCWAAIFTLVAGTQTPSALLQAQLWPSLPTSGNPGTGEGLEAQTWEGGGYMLAAGTEDEEFLRARIGNPKLRAEARYEPASLTVALSNLPPYITTEVHFIVAWNHFPEAVEGSCWYAVDQSHSWVAARVAT